MFEVRFWADSVGNKIIIVFLIGSALVAYVIFIFLITANTSTFCSTQAPPEQNPLPKKTAQISTASLSAFRSKVSAKTFLHSHQTTHSFLSLLARLDFLFYFFSVYLSIIPSSSQPSDGRPLDLSRHGYTQ